MTEEEIEKKKLKRNITLDDWYANSNKYLDEQRQSQLEDAYVNNQLMNKYLKQDIDNSGLGSTGIANDIYNNSNVNYRNERANINKSIEEKKLDLYNNYYQNQQIEKEKEDALAKEEQMKQDAINKQNQLDIYNSYLHKLDNSKNEYGFIDDNTMNELNNYFDRNSIGEHYSTLLDNYINTYRPTRDQLDKVNKDKAEKEASKYYEYYQSEFADDVANKTLEDGTISVKDAKELLNKLEANKDKLGEKYYIDALNTLKTLDRKSNEYRNEQTEEAYKYYQAMKEILKLSNFNRGAKLAIIKQFELMLNSFKGNGLIDVFNKKINGNFEEELKQIRKEI